MVPTSSVGIVYLFFSTSVRAVCRRLSSACLSLYSGWLQTMPDTNIQKSKSSWSAMSTVLMYCCTTFICGELEVTYERF